MNSSVMDFFKAMLEYSVFKIKMYKNIISVTCEPYVVYKTHGQYYCQYFQQINVWIKYIL